MNYRPHPLTKDELVRLYVEEGKSTGQVAKELGTSQVTVCKYLKVHGIKARPFSTKGMKTRLGAVLSKETREKIAKAHLGKKLSEEHKEKIGKWSRENNPFKGRHHTEESKEKQRQKMKGRKLTPEHRAKVLKALEKVRANAPKGEKAYGWKGGISRLNARLRQTREMNLWKKAVKERDNYTCVLCGFYSKSNHADHIKPFALFPELRTSIGNGRTLCVNCHRKTKTYGGRIRKVQPMCQ